MLKAFWYSFIPAGPSLYVGYRSESAPWFGHGKKLGASVILIKYDL